MTNLGIFVREFMRWTQVTIVSNMQRLMEEPIIRATIILNEIPNFLLEIGKIGAFKTAFHENCFSRCQRGYIVLELSKNSSFLNR